MPVQLRTKGYQVTVNRSDALKGSRNIKRQVSSRHEGERLEKAIHAAIDEYGVWPVSYDRIPLLVNPKGGSYPLMDGGSLRLAVNEAKKALWDNPDIPGLWVFARNVTTFFEDRRLFDLDEILEKDISAFLSKNFPTGTKEDHSDFLKTVYKMAMERTPPLISLSNVPLAMQPTIVTGWSKYPAVTLPEIKQVSNWHLNEGSSELADFFQIMAMLNLSFEGVCALRPSHLVKQEDGKAYVQLPQLTETQLPERIDLSVEDARSFEWCIADANSNGQETLFTSPTKYFKKSWWEARMGLGVHGGDLAIIPTQIASNSPRLILVS